MLQRIVAALLVCIILGVTFALFTSDCYAAGAGETDLMEKKGIGGLFAGKSFLDDPRAANKWQAALGIGSFVVMLAVLKWL